MTSIADDSQNVTAAKLPTVQGISGGDSDAQINVPEIGAMEHADKTLRLFTPKVPIWQAFMIFATTYIACLKRVIMTNAADQLFETVAS